MKMVIQFAVSLIIMTSCTRTEYHSAYSPKFKESWNKVEEEILRTWSTSKVDSTTAQMPGSLKLPYAYFSIHEGVNVLYCWDTYFTNAGLLLIDSFAPYAKNAVDNQFAEIEQIGFVPNASEPWGLNRSQTPFLSMMVREVYESGLADKNWLRHAYDMLKIDYLFWTDSSANAIEDHKTTVAGLQRFYHHATEEELLDFYKVLAPRFDLSDTLQREEKMKMGEAWLSEAETMDFTPRFENRCHQFIAVDLNANLFLYEKNFEWIVEELNLEDQTDWGWKAAKRKKMVTKYCWDEERGIFMDYDFVNNRFSKIASVATIYPLWAALATKQQAARVLENLPLFEFDYGPAVCEKSEQERVYQWDYPVGWPPVYLLVIKALDHYGYKKEALRIAAKYLDVVTKNFLKPEPEFFSSRIGGKAKDKKRKPGFVYEKYNVLDGTINDVEYASRPFHGWSYAVFIWCLDYYKRNS